MGLDTTHGCWHGSYGAFTRWRNRLAELAGYYVWPVKCDDGLCRDTIILDWGHITENNLYGHWEQPPDDPLIILLAHHDHDGVIHPEDAVLLADRLEELMPKLEREGDAPGHIGNWAEKTQKFIDGLRVAAEAGENVYFH